ncbi:GntR family transcriptional regulator [Kineosporia sp. J2-2]|uniref:GntR family transcriptional regulator n=1 Tax=Kineosporia corallincola TaxID=2835133 RepID=A0ABS5TNC2_9ACTN|nr:GntR family transcriptional regulator [Kineosporia corallincola]MBT0771884.1 GntR family transcriptional regulator [Kineosporia corallincola]
MKPEAARTAHRDVTDRLREAILTGALQAGTHLVQTELASGLRVSVTPVREALRELESQGLVDSDPFRGSSVHQVSLDELEEINEMRRLLTPMAVRERVTTITDAEIDQARALLGRMTPDLPNREWVGTARAVRRVLEGVPARRNLRAILRRLSEVSELYAGLAGHTQAERDDVLAEHRALLAAYADRDTGRIVEISLRRLDRATRRTAEAMTTPGN